MSRIWIVRHGNTFGLGETPRRIGARTDLPLVASGREQAHRLRDWLDRTGIRFDRVLASPLRRTVETARLVAGEARIEPCAWLAEIDHGPDEDRSEAEVLARIGYEALAAWDRSAVAPPGWTVDAESRIAGWRTLLADATGDTLIVTSNGAARFVFAAEPSLIPPAALKLRTGACGVLERADSGWRLADWNVRP